MPRKITIPPHLAKTAFRSSDTTSHGLGRGRLRGHGVEHPFHGVSSIELDLNSTVELCWAYDPVLKADSAFSHTTSARLHGIPLPTGSVLPLHVSCPGGGSAPRRKGVIGHSIETFERALVAGIPVVAPADTWCQLATSLGREDLVAAGDYLISGVRLTGGHRTQPLCTLAQLAEATARYESRRGATLLAWALPRLRTGVDSRMESRLRLLLVSAGLPEPVVALAIPVDSGRKIQHGDLAYEEWRIVFEYEGDDHRINRRRYLDDIARRELYEAALWRVVRPVHKMVSVETSEMAGRKTTSSHFRRLATAGGLLT
jgi:hypothetical protein